MSIVEIIALARAAFELYQKISTSVEESKVFTAEEKGAFKTAMLAAKEIPKEWEA